MAAGSIVLDLLMKTGSFETDTKRAEQSLKKFKAEAEKVGKAIGAAFVAVGGATALMVKGSIDAMDSMAKLAQATGTTVESLSALAYAADLSGVSQDTLGQSLQKLSRQAAEAAGGNKQIASSFDSIGVSVKKADGTLKTSDQLLGEIAGKFSGYADGAEKTALAQELFGKSGAQLIPLLNAGAEGLAQMTSEAEQLGLVIGTDAAKAAEQFNDNLTRLDAVKKGLVNRIAQQLLPMLTNLTGSLFESAKASGALDQAARAASSGVKILLSVGVVIGAAFKAIGETLGGLAAALVALFSGRFSDAFDIAKNVTFDFVANAKSAAGVVGTIWDETASKIDAASPETGKKLAAPVVRAVGAIKKGTKEAVDSVQKMIAAIQRDIATFGATTSQVRLMDIQAAGANPEQVAQATAYLAKLDALAKAEKDAADQKAEHVRQQERLNDLLGVTQLEKQREDMLLLSGAFETGKISAEEYGLAVKNALGLGDEEGGYWEKWLEAAGEALQSFDNLAQGVIENFTSGFGNAFEKMIFDSQSLGDAVRGMAESMARSVVNALGQMAAQWLAYQVVQSLMGKTAAASAATGQTFSAMAAQQMAALNAFASTAAIPVVGPAMAPAAAGAALAATSPFVATIASLGAASVGARATGGHVSASAPYLVGERGPEMFVPHTAGSIVPNNRMGGGGITVNLIEDKSRAGQTEERSNNGAREMDVFVADIMGDGPRGKAIQRAFGLQRKGY